MTVVDASVAAKLVLVEPDTERARKWFTGLPDDAVAPDLIAIEVAQAVVRRISAREVIPLVGRRALDEWRAIPASDGIMLVRVDPAQMMAAAELAITLSHPVKDCVYLALAMVRGTTLVTADARFVARALGLRRRPAAGRGRRLSEAAQPPPVEREHPRQRKVDQRGKRQPAGRRPAQPQ